MLLRTIVPLLKVGFFSSKKKVEEIVEELKVWFSRKEVNGFMHELMSCKAAVFLLPEDLCHKVAKRVAIVNTDVVSVSKEQFANVSYTIEIEFHVNPYYIRRLSYTKESGIPDWLPSVTRVMSRYERNINEASKSASLQGNVTMIFIIMGVGLALAFIVILVERNNNVWIYCTKKLHCRKWRHGSIKIFMIIISSCGRTALGFRYLLRNIKRLIDVKHMTAYVKIFSHFIKKLLYNMLKYRQNDSGRYQ